MGVEFELKFRANAQTLTAMDEAITGPRQVLQMQTTYYDTADKDLARQRHTLRRRMENDRSVCTLKAPAPDGGRLEFETESPKIEEAVPVLCKLSEDASLASLLEKGLVEVCGAKFTRIAKTVTLPDCTVELALDAGVLIGGDRELPLWEVEVELKSGSRQACLAYAAQLALAYGLEQEKLSKFRRALDLAEGV